MFISGPNDRPDVKMLYNYCFFFVNELSKLMIQECKPAKLISLLKQVVPMELLTNTTTLGLLVALVATEEIESLKTFLKIVE